MLPMPFDHSFNGRHYYTHRPPLHQQQQQQQQQEQKQRLARDPSSSSSLSTPQQLSPTVIPTASHFDPAAYVNGANASAPTVQAVEGAPETTPSKQQQQQQQADVPDKTFYRRELPASLTSLNSKQGRQLIKDSLASGYAEAFLQLSGNLAHQSDPAFCGLSSLAMVLNALEIDPKRQWKGVWRWYDETLLDCCAPLEQIKDKGMTFTEFACLARCNGLDVEAKSGDQVTLAQFLHDIKSVCSGDGSVQMVVSFSRKVLDQTGDGHFSPVAAFHEGEGKVLVLDVARFKYPSYFVTVEKLYEALKPVDRETGRCRGYFLLRKEET
ncbi:hypothetical protein HDU67_010369 [Dinochytrium kinnereticum]|nr:hypothetical protein HDU67_010369 [Dinochytrium kinnereticum]